MAPRDLPPGYRQDSDGEIVRVESALEKHQKEQERRTMETPTPAPAPARPPATRSKTCATPGCQNVTRYPCAQYCPPCAKMRDKASKRAYAERKRAAMGRPATTKADQCAAMRARKAAIRQATADADRFVLEESAPAPAVPAPAALAPSVPAAIVMVKCNLAADCQYAAACGHAGPHMQIGRCTLGCDRHKSGAVCVPAPAPAPAPAAPFADDHLRNLAAAIVRYDRELRERREQLVALESAQARRGLELARAVATWTNQAGQ